MPQENTWPLEVTATVWANPPATPITFVPPGSLAFTGASLPLVLPLPSWPTTFQPQAYTAPLFNARLWSTPPAIGLAFAFTFTVGFGFERALPAPDAVATPRASNSKPSTRAQPGAPTKPRLPRKRSASRHRIGED